MFGSRSGLGLGCDISESAMELKDIDGYFVCYSVEVSVRVWVRVTVRVMVRVRVGVRVKVGIVPA